MAQATVLKQLLDWVWQLGYALALKIPDEPGRAAIRSFNDAVEKLISLNGISPQVNHPSLGHTSIHLGNNPKGGLVVTAGATQGSIAIVIDCQREQLKITALGTKGMMAGAVVNSQSELVSCDATWFIQPDDTTDHDKLDAYPLFDLFYRSVPSLRRALANSQDEQAARILNELQRYWAKYSLNPDLVRYLRHYAKDYNISHFRLYYNARQCKSMNAEDNDLLMAYAIFLTAISKDWFDPAAARLDGAAKEKAAKTAAEHMEWRWGCTWGRAAHWALYFISRGEHPHPRSAKFYYTQLLKLANTD